MNHKEQIEEQAEAYAGLTVFVNANRPIEWNDHEFNEYIAKESFIKGANFALEMVLKELEGKRTEVIQINGLRTDVVAWSDIEALLGKFNTGF